MNNLNSFCHIRFGNSLSKLLWYFSQVLQRLDCCQLLHWSSDVFYCLLCFYFLPSKLQLFYELIFSWSWAVRQDANRICCAMWYIERCQYPISFDISYADCTWLECQRNNPSCEHTARAKGTIWTVVSILYLSLTNNFSMQIGIWFGFRKSSEFFLFHPWILGSSWWWNFHLFYVWFMFSHPLVEMFFLLWLVLAVSPRC